MTTRISILVIISPLLVLISDIQSARGAVVEAWVQRYNNVVSNSWDEAFKVAIDKAGDIIIAGSTDNGTTESNVRGPDMIVLKYSGTNGSVLWEKRHSSPAPTIIATGIAFDSNGNAIVTGASRYMGNLVVTQLAYAAKYAAADGSLLWEKIGQGGNTAVAVDSDDNVVVVGLDAATGSWDHYTAKYSADGSLLWKNVGQGGSTAVAVDSEDNVIVVGFDYTAKYAADGSLLWERRTSSMGGSAQAAALGVDGSGNVLVTALSNGDYYTAKYAALDGALVWERRYDRPVSGSLGSYDWPYSLAVDARGDVVVTGYSQSSTEGTVQYTAKYAAADGTLLWERSHAGSGRLYQSAPMVVVDHRGDVVLTAETRTGTNYSHYTVKYAGADGTLLWDRIGPYGTPGGLATDGTNVVIAGYSLANGSYSDAYTVKYAADGTWIWEQRYNTLANNIDSPVAVAADGDGNIVVTGYSVGPSRNFDYYTAKYAPATGALLWEQRYNGSGNRTDRPRALVVDISGNVIVTGESWGAGNSDFYTAKYAAATGALVWDRRYNGPQNGADFSYAVAVDSGGNILVAGASEGDYYTAKYAAASGALLWERHSSAGIASKVAVDSSDNVIVTGLSGGAYYTAKYAASDGSVLWERRSGPGRNDTEPVLAVDGSGNVVLAGSSDDDFYTVKMAAADGHVLWEQRYDGPGQWTDAAVAVAIDDNGNIVVTGYSHGSITRGSYKQTDYYTAKYAASNGALLWDRRYDGPGSPWDSASAVALDRFGNVVVTGGSGRILDGSTNGLRSDYYTAKYAAADGALLWERRYNGPADYDDFPGGVVITRNGATVVTGHTDLFGSSYVGRSDYATIAYWEDISPLSIDRVPTGLRIRLTGAADRTYQIERANAVTGPWSTVATVTAPSQGLIEYTDSNQPTGSVFYRARTQ